MKYSGLYFIPTPTAQPADSSTTATTLSAALESLFPTLARAPQWTLTYRLFRSPAPRTDPADPPVHHAHAHQHMLTWTALGTQRAYVHVTGSERATGSVTAIPAAQAEARALLLRHQLAALWTPRHTLSVQGGVCYTGGLFTIYIGEVRALREGQGGGVSSPGVVVCISTVAGGGGESEGLDGDVQGPEDGDPADFEAAQAAIREVWNRLRSGRDLGRAEVKEVFMAPGDAYKAEDTDATVRMWCEMLRLRG